MAGYPKYEACRSHPCAKGHYAMEGEGTLNPRMWMSLLWGTNAHSRYFRLFLDYSLFRG